MLIFVLKIIAGQPQMNIYDYLRGGSPVEEIRFRWQTRNVVAGTYSSALRRQR